MSGTIEIEVQAPADVCANERRARDAARDATRRMRAGYVYANQQVAYYLNLARTERDPTQAELDWMDDIEPFFDPAAVAARPHPQDTCGLCSTIWSWLGRRAQAYTALPPLEATARAAQAALRECLAGNPQAPADAPPPPFAPPESDDEAIELIGASGGDAHRVLCQAPRVGHGHVGDPCRVRLGRDGVCQYHG
jgi:hypothetical protein